MSTKQRIADIRARDPKAKACDIATELGVSKQRVSQVLISLGLTTRVGAPLSDDERREYKCWHNMISRCMDQDNSLYGHYGARGITVCSRWLNSFRDFAADMGPRPSVNHSIDRIDNDGNYEPSNCRWATKSEQRRNQRDVYAVRRTSPDAARVVWQDNSLTVKQKLAHPSMRGWTQMTAFRHFNATARKPTGRRKKVGSA